MSLKGSPWCCASKPQVRRASKPLGTNFETKIFKFRWFLGPSDQNELYHTPLISKIWDLGDRNFLVEDPFKSHLLVAFPYFFVLSGLRRKTWTQGRSCYVNLINRAERILTIRIGSNKQLSQNISCVLHPYFVKNTLRPWVFQPWTKQTWYLSKILHRQIFRLKVLHHKNA